MIFNKFEDNFMFAGYFLGKLPLFTDNLIIQYFELFRISIIYILLIILS